MICFWVLGLIKIDRYEPYYLIEKMNNEVMRLIEEGIIGY
jgi:hypothetical protein